MGHTLGLRHNWGASAATPVEKLRDKAWVFSTPTWLQDAKISSYTDHSFLHWLNPIQENAFNHLLDPGLFNTLLMNEAAGSKTYTLSELLNDLQKGIWGELATKEAIDIYRRKLQKMYINKMIDIVKPTLTTGSQPRTASAATSADQGGNARFKNTDVPSVAKANLVALRAKMRIAISVTQDTMTRYHLKDMIDRISNALAVKGEN